MPASPGILQLHPAPTCSGLSQPRPGASGGWDAHLELLWMDWALGWGPAAQAQSQLLVGVLAEWVRPRQLPAPSTPQPASLSLFLPPAWTRLSPATDRKGRAAAMPDSPAEVKTQPRATPPNMPPPPPAPAQEATRHLSFTPHTRE